nr:hypothetical protein CFP56_13047 [Quercus suber]
MGGRTSGACGAGDPRRSVRPRSSAYRARARTSCLGLPPREKRGGGPGASEGALLRERPGMEGRECGAGWKAKKWEQIHDWRDRGSEFVDVAMSKSSSPWTAHRSSRVQMNLGWIVEVRGERRG